MPRKNKNDDSNVTLEDARDVFVQGAGKISSALLGMVSKVGGQIYALLFLSDEPLCLDVISDRLGVSKSNVSINVRLLEDFGLVRKVWVKGSRKDYYAAERIYPKKIIRDFLENIQSTMTDAITTIERTKAKVALARVSLDGEKRAEADFMMKQLNLIGLFYYAANEFFDDFFEGRPVDMELVRRAILNPEEISRKKSS